LLSTDAGNYSQLLNWQISERWLPGKRCSEDVPTSGGENTLRPACVEHAQPESRSRRTAFPNSWARSSALRPCFGCDYAAGGGRSLTTKCWRSGLVAEDVYDLTEDHLLVTGAPRRGRVGPHPPNCWARSSGGPLFEPFRSYRLASLRRAPACAPARRT
jgi:hypothetical protein